MSDRFYPAARKVLSPLVAGAMFLLVFAMLAYLVRRERAPGLDIDRVCRTNVEELMKHHPAIIHICRRATYWGHRAVLLIAAAAATIVLLCRRRRLLACVGVLVMLGGMFLIDAVKTVVARERPLPPELAAGMSPSFPSGHAGGAMLVGGFIAYCLMRSDRRSVRFAGVALITIAPMVGVTRIVLGVHWFTDVLGGWLFGLGWLLIGVAQAEAANGAPAVKGRAPPPANTAATAP